MQSKEKIEKVLRELPSTDTPSKFPAMTYEQGVEEVLLWVLEELSDEEFEYSQ